MFSPTSIPVDQHATGFASMTLQQITDATDDQYLPSCETVEPSNVYRRSSIDIFGGSSFNEFEDSLFGTSSFTFGSSNPQWSAVNKAKEERFRMLPRRDSFASNFTGMTGDELSDEVEPWGMATDSRFDFGFSSALRETCLYRVPREYLPSDDSNDTDVEDGSDLAADTDMGEDMDEDVSETETVCGDVPELDSLVEEREQSPAPVEANFMPPSVSPITPTTPVRPIASLPRRSARVSRPSRAKLAEQEEPTTPTKRRQVSKVQPKDVGASPSKKVAFTGKTGKPSAQPPRKAARISSGKAQKSTRRRVVLRV
ncbi:hypothetical protein C8R43DRAFT_976752 [Mycena crocata]|nr:hypothetical protein C8R43DRAFT_976752 [Mycena crocata]